MKYCIGISQACAVLRRIKRSPRAKTARASSTRMIFGRVFLESFAPSCAPQAAPIPIQMAGSQMTWCSAIWEITPIKEEQANTKWEVAVATCTGKSSR